MEDTGLFSYGATQIMRAEASGYGDGLHGRNAPSEEVKADPFLLERYHDRRKAAQQRKALEDGLEGRPGGRVNGWPLHLWVAHRKGSEIRERKAS